MSDTDLDQIADAYPLTPMQSGMLFHVIGDPKPGQYLGTMSALIEGPLREADVRRAWGELLDRHEALRTGFLWENLDAPMQVVYNNVELDFQWHAQGDWSAHLDEVRSMVPDVSNAPLSHVRIIAEGSDRFRLVWALHHMIADGWSAGVLLREFLSLLNGAALPEAPQFVMHAEWLDGLDHQSDADFWLGYFAGFQVNALAPKGVGTGFEQIPHALEPALLETLHAQARSNGVTLSTQIQAAFAHAVGHLTGKRDVIFGLATSGRSSNIEGVEGCVGLFVNTLPVRVELDALELLADLEQTGLSLRSREHVPQSLLMKWSDTPRGQNLTEVVLSLRSLPEIPAVGVYKISELETRTPSNFPLVVELDPESGKISALYNREILNGPQVSAFLTSFELALRGANEPARRIAALEGPALEAAPVDLVYRILEQAEMNAEAPAVADAEHQLTYRQLLEQARSIGSFLAAKGIGPKDRVALVFPRNSDMIAALLGTLIAGAAYVPVDANYPAQRIADILADCAPKLVLGAGAEGAVALSDIPKASGFAPVTVTPEDPAYVIYTSGSTGKPKGVEISRGALAASQSARDQFYPEAPGAFLLMSPFAFDSSIVGIFWALSNGANLVIAQARAEQDMDALCMQIAELGVTHMLMLPTLYQALLSNSDPAYLRSLRQVIVAGETCPRDLPQRHAALLPECWLANEYGPTEATVWAIAELNGPREAAPMSIGRPIPGTQVFLLGANGQTVSAGEVGEIALAGPGLATKYLNRPEETAKAFPQIALGDGQTLRIYRTGDRGRLGPDDRIHYLGRGDGQVKIRGHRIELQDVEAAIGAIDGVRDVAVQLVPARAAEIESLKAILETLDPNEAADLIAKAKGRDNS